MTRVDKIISDIMKGENKMRKLLTMVLVIVLALSFVACSGQQTSEEQSPTTSTSSGSEETTAETTAPVSYDWPMVGETDNVKMVNQEPSKPLTFAFIGFQNNPFWDLVQQGVEAATECLATHNVTVENMNMGENITADALNAGLEAAIAKGVDGIVITPFVTGVENYINEAIANGIPVVSLYGESAATKDNTDRLCFIGQDNEVMGKVVGEAIINKTEPGKYAVITAQFTMENLELKRNTAQKILDDAGYEFVGAYEAHDSADETYSLTQDILTAHPDITAIYCVAGGNYGCPKAVADMDKTGSVYVIGHDETAVNLEFVRTGEMDVVGQNPTGVAFDGFMHLYNKVVADKDPEQEIFAAYSVLIDQDNVNELFPK